MSAITDIDTFINGQPSCSAIEAVLYERSKAYLDLVGSRPLPPKLQSTTPTVAELAAYQRALEAYEAECAAQAQRAYDFNQANDRLMHCWHQVMRCEFSALAPEFAAMSDALFNVCYDEAYSRYHSSGVGEVRNGLIGIAEFALRAISATSE